MRSIARHRSISESSWATRSITPNSTNLRWYIDTIDGRAINPDSNHPDNPATGGPIDYMNAFQAAGLDPSIPWYQVIGNHDQFFGGAALTNDYVRTTLTGGDILNVGNLLTNGNDLDSRGLYMGVVDGTTPYGQVVGVGPVSQITPPKVIPNPAAARWPARPQRRSNG